MWRQSEGYIFLTLLLTRPRSIKQFCGCLASAVEHFVHNNFELWIRESRSVGFASKGWNQCPIFVFQTLISLVVVAVLDGFEMSNSCQEPEDLLHCLLSHCGNGPDSQRWDSKGGPAIAKALWRNHWCFGQPNSSNSFYCFGYITLFPKGFVLFCSN